MAKDPPVPEVNERRYVVANARSAMASFLGHSIVQRVSWMLQSPLVAIVQDGPYRFAEDWDANRTAVSPERLAGANSRLWALALWSVAGLLLFSFTTSYAVRFLLFAGVTLIASLPLAVVAFGTELVRVHTRWFELALSLWARLAILSGFALLVAVIPTWLALREVDVRATEAVLAGVFLGSIVAAYVFLAMVWTPAVRFGTTRPLVCAVALIVVMAIIYPSFHPFDAPESPSETADCNIVQLVRLKLEQLSNCP